MTLPLPDLELGPLEAIDPQHLVQSSQDDLGELMLGLALAFNDLKDFEYLAHQMRGLRQDAQADTLARLGQFAGMQHHVSRMMCAVAHEILELLSKAQKTVQTAQFQALIQPLNQSYKDDWQEVWAAAQHGAKGQKGSLAHSLMRVRNNLAFHYDTGALVNGFSAHFGSARQHSKAAVVSVGDSMEANRFYYADAAAAAYLEDRLGLDNQQISAVLGRLNRVLNAVLREFVDARAPKRLPYSSQG